MGTTLIGRVAGAIALAAALWLGTARAQNYSDIWWNSAESGWGLTVADHESQLFAVWFTYREDGRPTWYVVPGGTLSADRRTFQGDMYATTGPAYSAAPFDPARVTVRKVGSATIDFAPPGLAAGSALFTYSLNGVTQSKQIRRQPFGDSATAWGSDVTDIWFNPSQSGWGLTLAQHGSNVFGVWFTYDTDGQPLWAVMPGVTFNGPDNFTGTLYTTTGPYFGSVPFDPSRVVATPQGSATVTLNRQGPASPQCAGSTSAVFNPAFRAGAPSSSICPQGFGDTMVDVAVDSIAPADSLSGGAASSAGQEGSLASAGFGFVAADMPELASLAASLAHAEIAARSKLGAQVGKSTARLPSAKATDADPTGWGGLGYVVASTLSNIGNDFTGRAVPQQDLSASASQDNASVSVDLGFKTDADGTISVSSGMTAKAEGNGAKIEESAWYNGAGKLCPAADGTITFKYTIHTDVSGSAGTKRAGAQYEVTASGTAFVNDEAYVEHVDFDIRTQVAKQRPDSHNAYVDGHFTGSLGGPWTPNYHTAIQLSPYTTVTRRGSTTTKEDAAEMLAEARQRAIHSVQGYMEYMQAQWRDGDCVQVVASAPSTVAPAATVSIDAKVRHKVEGAELHLPIDAQLAGAASLQPARIAASPGTFVYVAPSQTGQSATLTFTSTSRRGIGTLALTIRTAAEGYAVDWSDGQGNHVFGTICSGLDSAFTLNFTSGTDIQGTLAFTPTGASGGKVHLSGTGLGGVITYAGDGTYTLTGSSAIQMTIPQQIGTVQLPTGPQVIPLPGPSGTLPLQPTTQCNG
jgi:hypothetical protein